MQRGTGLPPRAGWRPSAGLSCGTPRRQSALSAEGVAADEQEKWCRVSLSAPAGEPDMVAVDAVAVLHTGSGLRTMSAVIARKLSDAYADLQFV